MNHITKKIITSGIIAGFFLLALSILGIYLTPFFPGIAMEYFNPAFNTSADKVMIFYLHPFIISFALSWFWSRFKSVLSGSFLTRGVEFGLIYVLIANFPMLWLIYSSMDVSFPMVTTWFLLALAQGIIAGLIFEKTNP